MDIQVTCMPSCKKHPPTLQDFLRPRFSDSYQVVRCYLTYTSLNSLEPTLNTLLLLILQGKTFSQ